MLQFVCLSRMLVLWAHILRWVWLNKGKSKATHSFWPLSINMRRWIFCRIKAWLSCSDGYNGAHKNKNRVSVEWNWRATMIYHACHSIQWPGEPYLLKVAQTVCNESHLHQEIQSKKVFLIAWVMIYVALLRWMQCHHKEKQIGFWAGVGRHGTGSMVANRPMYQVVICSNESNYSSVQRKYQVSERQPIMNPYTQVKRTNQVPAHLLTRIRHTHVHSTDLVMGKLPITNPFTTQNPCWLKPPSLTFRQQQWVGDITLRTPSCPSGGWTPCPHLQRMNKK